MQVFALGILVVQIADRDGHPELAPFYLGLMGLARALPGIPGTVIAGAVADRVDRRRILFITQTTMAISALALATLAYLGMASLPVVLVAATIQAAAFSFDNPARQSIVPRIVPLPFFPSAIGLQSAAFNGAAIIGPLLAGVLFVPIGIGGLLLVNALSFAAVLGALFVMPRVPPAARPVHGILHSVLEGARYIKADPVLVWIITISGSILGEQNPVSGRDAPSSDA